MIAYIVRRLFAGIIMLIVMSFVTFLLFFAGPTQPALFACGRGCTPDRLAVTEKSLGYDKPVVVQWADFMKGAVQGRDYPGRRRPREDAPRASSRTVRHPCLGRSNLSNANVQDLLKEAFPVSASLALMAFVLWITGGVLFGVIAALRKGTHHRPGHRRPRPDLLRLPDLLRRFVPPQVHRDQVADRASPLLHALRPRIRASGCRACSSPGSPSLCSSWAGMSG